MVLQLLHGFHAPQIVFSLKMFMSKYCIFLNQKYNPGEIFQKSRPNPPITMTAEDGDGSKCCAQMRKGNKNKVLFHGKFK